MIRAMWCVAAARNRAITSGPSLGHPGSAEEERGSAVMGPARAPHYRIDRYEVWPSVNSVAARRLPKMR